MVKKSFFKDRTVSEIKKLDIKKIGPEADSRHIAARVMELEPGQGLELEARITPDRFFIEEADSQRASMLNLRHGDYFRLDQPKTLKDAILRTSPTREQIRADLGYAANSGHLDEELGYSFRPVQVDRIKRVVPFTSILEGARLFTYAMTHTGGIDVYPLADAGRVATEGAKVVCSVPSRSKKESRYRFTLESIPINDNEYALAIALGVTPKIPTDPETGEPTGKRPLSDVYRDLRYTARSAREGSRTITLQPHDIAAYYAVAAHFAEKGNRIPFDTMPFLIPSTSASEFYMKLCNNVVIDDIFFQTGLRHLHLDEKANLLAHGMQEQGFEDFTWFHLEDGKLADYAWQKP